MGRSLGASVWRRVVSVFGQFPLLTVHSLLLNEKAKLLLFAPIMPRTWIAGPIPFAAGRGGGGGGGWSIFMA
jgi:hypothetical protein